MSNQIDRGVVNKFNRGEVAPEAFAREDVERLQNSCELMENYQPERLGPMRFRSGTELILGSVEMDDNTKLIPFNTDLQDPILLLLSDNTGNSTMTFLRQDAVITGTVTTTGFQNGDFTTGFAAGEWVDDDEGVTATSVITSGVLRQTGTGVEAAKAYQTSDSTDTGTAHMMEFRVDRGSVLIQIGENGSESSDIFEERFEVGYHFIEFTPTGDFTVTISNDRNIPSEVSVARIYNFTSAINVPMETALDVIIPGSNSMDTLRKLRWAPSANVQYFCGDDWIPFRIRRHGSRSFSVERYVNVFGPYLELNTTSITMDPVAPLDGDTQVNTNRRYFDLVHDSNKGYSRGTLLRLAVNGQTRTVTGTTVDTATEGVFIFGTGDARKFTVDIDTTGAYTEILLEKSFDEITWQEVKSYTSGADVNEVYDDQLDGAEVFYRLRLATVGAASALTMTLSYDYGTLEAEGRIREVSGAGGNQIQVQWYVPLNEDQVVKDWYLGAWGGRNPFPTACALYEGRLWFAGNNFVWGSESDFYESFDRNIEGNSASIQRSIGFGASKDILWLAPSARLVMGTELNEIDIRSTAFGETLNPENTNLKEGSSRGCANVNPIVLDQEVIFVQRGGKKLLGIDFNIDQEKHSIEDFNMLHPKIFGDSKIVALAYQTNPEMRIYCVLDDETVRVLLRDASEGILAWYRMDFTRGNNVSFNGIKDVAVLPGVDEDLIYFSTSDERLLKLAPSNSADGSSASKHFDRFVYYNSPGAVITLEQNQSGTLAVWADGEDRGDFTASGGTLDVGTAYTDVVVGYRYTAKYKSPKLGDYTSRSVLAANKRILDTALIMKDYIQGSVTIGADENNLFPMPATEKGKAAADDDEYDELPFDYDGISETDPRIHIHATGPCNIQALVYEVKETDRRVRKNQNA
jgi:hypothetical protein